MSLLAEHIVNRLEKRLNSSNDTTPVSLISGSKHKYFSSPTVVSFEKMDDSNTTLLKIETIDRTGVLANIAKAFVDCKIRILNARITTAGEKAIDYYGSC